MGTILLIIGIIGWIWMTQRNEREKISTEFQTKFSKLVEKRNEKISDALLNVWEKIGKSKKKDIETLDALGEKISIVLDKYDEKVEEELSELYKRKKLEML